jgi:hypothetical protein
VGTWRIYIYIYICDAWMLEVNRGVHIPGSRECGGGRCVLFFFFFFFLEKFDSK